MTELSLVYKNANGDEKRVTVDSESFVVGRHSSCDLVIADGRLSREHLKIERFGDVFVASDRGSSNGSRLNDIALNDPAALRNGDVIELGGGVNLIVEFGGENANSGSGTNGSTSSSGQPEASSSANANTPGSSSVASTGNSNGIPTSLLIIAPFAAVMILVFGAFAIYLLSSGKSEPRAPADEEADILEVEEVRSRPKTSETPVRSAGAERSINPKTDSSVPTSSDTVEEDGRATEGTASIARIERNAAVFLRRIAQNDPAAFITSDQARRLSTKIDGLRTSPVLSANLSTANRSKQQIAALASSKNLKPDLLAIAAVNKLGRNRGDVLATARSMADTLDKLQTQVNTEFGEDALLLIAAYDQGSRGEFLKMRNMLQEISNKFPDSSRSIRTIWFLEKQGKLTREEFESAFTFLAIGTIAQSPKDFGIEAEPLQF